MKTTMHRVETKPELLRWARERAGLDVEALTPPGPRPYAGSSRRSRLLMAHLLDADIFIRAKNLHYGLDCDIR